MWTKMTDCNRFYVNFSINHLVDLGNIIIRLPTTHHSLEIVYFLYLLVCVCVCVLVCARAQYFEDSSHLSRYPLSLIISVTRHSLNVLLSSFCDIGVHTTAPEFHRVLCRLLFIYPGTYDEQIFNLFGIVNDAS